MRATSVVMGEVLIEDVIEVAVTEDHEPVQGFVADGLDQPLAMCVGTRASVGAQQNLGPFTFRHRVEPGAEGRAAIVEEEAEVDVGVPELPDQVSKLLRRPVCRRVVGGSPPQSPSRTQLQEHDHVKRAQEDGINGHKIAGDHAGGVRAQEVSPGRTATPSSRTEPIPFEDPPNRACADPVAELTKLARDAQIPPSPVLACQPQDQILDLAAQLRPAAARPSSEGGPASANQFAMPAEQGRRGEHQAAARKEAAERREDEPVRIAEVWSLHGSTEDGDLMAKCDHFDLKVCHRSGAHEDQVGENAKQPVDGAEEHRFRRVRSGPGGTSTNDESPGEVTEGVWSPTMAGNPMPLQVESIICTAHSASGIYSRIC